MQASKPTPLIRPGMDFIASELDVQYQKNGELSLRVRELEERIQQLEKIISSYQNSPSGTNNVVLL